MICPKCGQDKAKIIRVYRNLIYRDGKWRRANVDTREIMCNECGTRYFTETHLSHKIKYDEHLMKKIIVEIPKIG